MIETAYKRTYSEDWDFRYSDTKEFTHSYHNYPAMMIPQIARKLIEDFSPKGEVNLVFDPYMGSGTTLVESKIKGINSIGTDINPLARFMAKVKTTNYDVHQVDKLTETLKNKTKLYKPNYSHKLPNVTNVDFWYSKDNVSELCFLTNEINSLNSEIKDFFLIALSECVREVSYTRNGEFKRYRMAEDKITSYKPDTFELFFEKVKRNRKGLIELNSVNSQAEVIISDFNSVYNIPDNILSNNSVDLVVTSPPYGDSRTTVAYGQFSRWANEWFNFENAKNLDNLLMGGTKIKKLSLKTESISNELNQIKSLDEKRYQEVLYFLDDYYNSINNVSNKIRIGGRVCYVVGNRNVKGIQIPLDYFTVESFERNGFKHIDTFVRKIPNKRMPSKTSPTNKKGLNVTTMMNEFIIILEKESQHLTRG